MRIYVPSTFALASSWLESDEFSCTHAFAVTDALRNWYEEGDDEALEYTASLMASRESLNLVAEEIDATPRRVVLALDVDTSIIGPEIEPRGAIALLGPLQFSQVASALIDGDEATVDVLLAATLLERASAGDGEAQFVVSQVEGHELLWFDPSEIEFVLKVDR